MKSLIYAGIGPRNTPSHIQNQMTHIAQQLSADGWMLRSGHAVGADQAFERGALHRQIFLPWESFNGAKSNGVDVGKRELDRQQLDIAIAAHPNWDACKQGAKCLLARNVPIILGEDLSTPVDCVIFWTPNEGYQGGTMHAIRIASAWGIPTFDIRKEADQAALCKFTWDMENQANQQKQVA